VNCVTLLSCNVINMHCISLDILSQLNRIPSPALAQIDLSVLTCLFNGTSTQIGQFVLTAAEGSRLRRLRMAKRYNIT